MKLEVSKTQLMLILLSLRIIIVNCTTQSPWKTATTSHFARPSIGSSAFYGLTLVLTKVVRQEKQLVRPEVVNQKTSKNLKVFWVTPSDWFGFNSGS